MTTNSINLLSEEQLAKISSGKLWSFHGGIYPNENKQQTNQAVIKDAGIPPFLVIAIEHKDHTPQLLVKVGDSVLKGQPLTKVYGAMVVQHASSSGVVSAIEKRADLHPSCLPVLSVVIATDGLDRTIEYSQCADYKTQANALLIKKIQDAGIVGLGGAGFPSHLKLPHPDGTKLLIINAVECEPYISADDRLMQEHGDEIIDGITVLQHILKPELTVIAIEDNKPEAIAAIRLAVQKKQQTNIIISTIPTCYPSGSEKQLIEMISGQQTPIGKHPSELGVVMHNVGTVFAIKEAIIDGKPLTSRIVTLTGDAVATKGNLSVRIGTPIQYLLDKYGFNKQHSQKLIIGGPMMGFSISHADIPVTKTCNCILAPTLKEMPDAPPEVPCIRCGECADVCPALLLPQQLFWYSKSQDHNKLDEYNLSSCIECGACAYVCPSHIPLVQYYRVAKADIKSTKQQAEKAEIARIRFEHRAARLAQAKLDRQAKHKEAAEKRKQQMQEKNGGEDLIAAALARAKAKKQDAAQSSESAPGDSKKEAIAAAIARAKAKKQSAAQNSESAPDDTKKEAVAAAIARAKAKKQAAAQSSESAPDDTKKEAVAAAIARAKAKKQAAAQSEQQGNENSEVDNTELNNTELNNTEAIAARKKRKEQVRLDKLQKQASQPEQQEVDSPLAKERVADKKEPAGDDKKAKIAAAIAKAKAKAKKAAQKDQ
ncbi:MAG: electron transport complex protein RnfC [Psychromonas sp.]|jgi:electron transport complex protein RnfC|uniref:electron transport complex subunit RsxC n=1 Tax=Psychromonas sp. TaxID=1884585 RepID=UPI0039E48E81